MDVDDGGGDDDDVERCWGRVLVCVFCLCPEQPHSPHSAHPLLGQDAEHQGDEDDDVESLDASKTHICWRVVCRQWIELVVVTVEG